LLGFVLGFVAVVLIVIVGAVVRGVPIDDLREITVATAAIVGSATAAYRAVSAYRPDRSAP
jgi:hypothetical protein